jgi:hypothetical protein
MLWCYDQTHTTRVGEIRPDPVNGNDKTVAETSQRNDMNHLATANPPKPAPMIKTRGFLSVATEERLSVIFFPI